MPVWKTREHLDDHFRRHGHEVGARTVAEYDASAQETYRIGEIFGYEDPNTDERHVGYFDPTTRRFAATDEYDKLVSHFRTDDTYIDWLKEQGEA